MALKMTCDGCGGDIPVDTVPIGRIERVFYCPTCKLMHDETDKTIETLRTSVVMKFEDGRRVALARLRKRLKKLPDE